MRCVCEAAILYGTRKSTRGNKTKEKKPLSRADIGLAGLAVEVEETRGRANEVGGMARWEVEGREG